MLLVVVAVAAEVAPWTQPDRRQLLLLLLLLPLR